MKLLLVLLLALSSVGCTQYKRLIGTDEDKAPANVCGQANLDYTAHPECVVRAMDVQP